MDDDAVRGLPRKVWAGAVPAGKLSSADLLARYMLENPGASGRAASRDLGIPESTVRRLRSGS
jgi:hypothetical protein